MAARAPLLGPGPRGRRLLSAASSSFGPAALPGVRPGILARQPSRGGGPPCSTLPSWTHEDTSVHARGRDRSPEERRTRHITAAVMRLHSLQVCASSHAARPGCFSTPPLSHTHSRREPGEGRRIRDGEMLIIRGEATDSSHSPPKRHPRHPAAAHTGVLPSSTRLQRSEWAGQGFLSGQLSLSHRAGAGTEKPGFSRQPQPTTG